MTKITFQNPGLIPIEAIKTLGVSVKDGSAIGYFGTGLKFAIATILRLGGSLTIWRGMERLDFGKKEVEIRGKGFELVTMNGVDLGFTTELGRDWVGWMAFRELASNARDEGGDYGLFSLAPLDGVTVIEVDCEEVVAAYHERETLFLSSSPIAVIDDIEVHEGQSDSFFYRGVRVASGMKPAAYRYNVMSSISLTEDRTAKNPYEIMLKIARALAQSDRAELIQEVLHRPEGTIEFELDFGWISHGETFKEQINLLNPQSHKGNKNAREIAHGNAIARAMESEPVQINPVWAAMLERSKKILIGAGFNVESYPIKIVDDLGSGVHGLAKNGTIFISRLPFQKGTREVAATLIEEFAHLESGAGDCTREFQNWIFDALLTKIEHENGDAF